LNHLFEERLIAQRLIKILKGEEPIETAKITLHSIDVERAIGCKVEEESKFPANLEADNDAIARLECHIGKSDASHIGDPGLVHNFSGGATCERCS
jgi:hypothetical protein